MTTFEQEPLSSDRTPAPSVRPAIDIRYLRVDYGSFVAVDDLTLAVPPGEVFGLVGPNGAGKTSTFRVLATLMEPTYGEVMLDLIYGMANGLHLIDSAWYRHSRASLLAGVPVRVAPPEELILHRLFIGERHRSDSADVVHLLMLRGSELDWPRLIRRVGDHWRLLLGQVLLFDFAYPGRRNEVPNWVREELLERARSEIGEVHSDPDVAQGTLISRFSYAIDVNEWGFKDYRRESVMAARSLPIVDEIAGADVWESVNQEQGLDEEGVATGWGPVPLPTLDERDAVVDPYTEPER